MLEDDFFQLRVQENLIDRSMCDKATNPDLKLLWLSENHDDPVESNSVVSNLIKTPKMMG